MMKRKLSLALAVMAVLSFILVGCGEKVKTFDSASGGYSIEVPDSWTSYFSGKDDSSFFSYYSKNDPASVTVSVFDVDTEKYTDVSAWWEMSAERLAESFDGVGDISVSNVTVSGRAALRVEFSATVTKEAVQVTSEGESDSEADTSADTASGEAVEYRYRFRHLIVMKDSSVYDVVCSALEENFGEHSDGFDDILASFALTERTLPSDSANTDGAPEGMQNGGTVYTQYTVCVPIDWTVDENDGSFDAHAADGTSVNIISWELDGGMTLENWWKSYLADITPVLSDIKVISEEAATVDGKEAVLHRFTGTSGGVEYEFTQYALIHDYILHVITYTTEGEVAALHGGELASIIDSFKLK